MRSLILSLVLAALGCGGDTLQGSAGELLVHVLNPDDRDRELLLEISGPSELVRLRAGLGGVDTTLTPIALRPGEHELALSTFDDAGALQKERFTESEVGHRVTTEVTFDLDEPVCRTLVCEAGTIYALTGDNTAAGSSSCDETRVEQATVECCEEASECSAREAELCAASQNVLADAGLCEVLVDCDTGSPTLEIVPDGTPCAGERVCLAGDCVSNEPEVGCSDGTREGFIDVGQYPWIAGCSGAWSVGGLIASELAPTCSRGGGNDSAHADGAGCSAADLCAAGWHVCRGKEDVADASPDGCDGAVPAGAPDKSLLFAVVQHSTLNSVCDQSDEYNDVFGCGNLGHELPADKGCGPLNRALASMIAGACGFNEAEPPLGPWVCTGSENSHLNEGGLVRKDGCPGGSCTWDGAPLDSSDKGGVLCCRD